MSVPRPEEAAPRRGLGSAVGPDLVARVLASLVLIPLVLLAAWLGGAAFSALCGLAAVLLLNEWNGVTRGGRRDAVFAAVLGLLVLTAVLAVAGRPLAAAGVLLAGAAAVSVLFPGERAPAWAAAGLLYTGALPPAAEALRADDGLGFPAVLWLLTVVWATDVAAYFAGRILQGPRLWPQVSPKKTWSGAVGGLVVGALLGALVARLTAGSPVLPVLLLSAAVSVAAQAGDLLESGVKRRFGVKDASRLIPGHGGLMDRVDSLVTALAAAVLIGAARGYGNAAAGLLSW